MVEHRSVAARVAGSNPVVHPKFIQNLLNIFLEFSEFEE